ncbi:exonuclease [Microbacterium phage Cece]|nr:exonuclease [Microbacterium phage Cece]
MTLVGIDFEMANAIPGSICAYGLAYEDGTVHRAVTHLHPERGGKQERKRFHGITAEQTLAGRGPHSLYSRLQALPEDTILVAHDAKIDRAQLYGWYEMWELEPIHFLWLDTLSIARQRYGKQGRVGVAAMAAYLDMEVKPHDPADDARVALRIAQTYDWGNVQLFHPLTGTQKPGTLAS